jgi:hypothetical protein
VGVGGFAWRRGLGAFDVVGSVAAVQQLLAGAGVDRLPGECGVLHGGGIMQ